MSRRPASRAKPNSTSRIRARPPWATSEAAGCASSSTAARPPSAKRPKSAQAAAWSRRSAKAQTAIQAAASRVGDELHRELGHVAQLPGQQHHGDGEDAESAAGRRAKERALPCQRHDGRDGGQPEGPARGGPDGVHGRDGVVEASGQRGIGVVEGRHPGRRRRGTSGRGRRGPPPRSRRAAARPRGSPCGAGPRSNPAARRRAARTPGSRPAGSRAARTRATRRRRAGRDSSASRCRTDERSKATCSRRPAAASSPAAISGRTSERQRNSGSFTRRRNRMNARPTRAPPATTRSAVRTTSPEERLRCSRMKLSGTWIDGRNAASRGPWKTAVSRGRASPDARRASPRARRSCPRAWAAPRCRPRGPSTRAAG